MKGSDPTRFWERPGQEQSRSPGFQDCCDSEITNCILGKACMYDMYVYGPPRCRRHGH